MPSKKPKTLLKRPTRRKTLKNQIHQAKIPMDKHHKNKKLHYQSYFHCILSEFLQQLVPLNLSSFQSIHFSKHSSISSFCLIICSRIKTKATKPHNTHSKSMTRTQSLSVMTNLMGNNFFGRETQYRVFDLYILEIRILILYLKTTSALPLIAAKVECFPENNSFSSLLPQRSEGSIQSTRPLQLQKPSLILLRI